MKQIVIGTSYVAYADESRRASQSVALQALSTLTENVHPVVVSFTDEPRYEELKELGIPQLRLLERDTTQDFGTIARKLPYVKEMLNLLSEIDCDVFGLVKSDILLNQKTCDSLQTSMFESYVFSRSDIDAVTKDQFVHGSMNYITCPPHAGADGFFFEKDWWLKNSSLFHDNLIFAETEWDTFYRRVMINQSKCLQSRCLYHVYHDQSWDTINPLAQNNIKILLGMI